MGLAPREEGPAVGRGQRCPVRGKWAEVPLSGGKNVLKPKGRKEGEERGVVMDQEGDWCGQQSKLQTDLAFFFSPPPPTCSHTLAPQASRGRLFRSLPSACETTKGRPSKGAARLWVPLGAAAGGN